VIQFPSEEFGKVLLGKKSRLSVTDDPQKAGLESLVICSGSFFRSLGSAAGATGFRFDFPLFQQEFDSLGSVFPPNRT
jgi:hypothetical protein